MNRFHYYNCFSTIHPHFTDQLATLINHILYKIIEKEILLFILEKRLRGEHLYKQYD